MIYVHIPFCRSFCTYCGFYSEVAGKDSTRYSAYVDSLVAEAAMRKDEIEAGLGKNTLYIGGGTPSVLPLVMLGRIVEALPYGPFEEFTVEVNPEDIVEKGLDYALGLKALGVNRVSMGVQSFDDCTLRWMNRRHDYARARQAFHILRQAGFDNLSIDLIFGISGVSEQQWRETVRQAIHIGDGKNVPDGIGNDRAAVGTPSAFGKPQHISAYQLSIEEGSALEKMIADGRYAEASEEECRRQYEILCEELSAAGYNHYEISNFALPGFEARHNSAYWERIPYTGLGAGAHSFDGRTRRWNPEMDDHGTFVPTVLAQSSVAAQPDAVTRSGDGSGSLSAGDVLYESLSDEDVQVERIMLALRTAKGLDAGWLRRVCGEKVDRLVAEGALEEYRPLAAEQGTMIRIPESRFFVSDDIIRELL